MFGAEPQERLTREERKDFEDCAAAKLKEGIRAALRAGALFLVNVLLIVPFAAGQPFHRYWNSMRFLVLIAIGIWVWLVLRVALVWGTWQAGRDTRRGFREADDENG